MTRPHEPEKHPVTCDIANRISMTISHYLRHYNPFVISRPLEVLINTDELSGAFFKIVFLIILVIFQFKIKSPASAVQQNSATLYHLYIIKRRRGGLEFHFKLNCSFNVAPDATVLWSY